MANEPTKQPGPTITVNVALVGLILAIATNLLAVGFSHGTIMAELKTLSQRVERFERIQDDKVRDYDRWSIAQERSKNYFRPSFGASEAVADTIGESNDRRTKERLNVRRQENP